MRRASRGEGRLTRHPENLDQSLRRTKRGTLAKGECSLARQAANEPRDPGAYGGQQEGGETRAETMINSNKQRD